MKDSMRDGPVYDMRRPPKHNPVSDVELMALEGRQYGVPAAKYNNPVDEMLSEAAGLREHLEENYDYAKEVEASIDHSRRQIAEDILKLQKNLTKVQKQKDSIEGSIKTDYFKEMEQQVVPSENAHEFVEFEAI